MRESERKFQVTWLMRGLALGLPPDPAALKILRDELGITALAHCRTSATVEAALWSQSGSQSGVDVLSVPWSSERNQSVELLQRGVERLDAVLAAGGKLLVICEEDSVHGPMLALCLLVHRGQPPLDAFEQLKKARPTLSPSPEQLEDFRAWARHQLRLGRATWSVPPFMQLAKVAYSHLKVAAMGA